MITMIKLAILNIKENKKWAFMTITGISISIMLITMVISFGFGTYQSVKEEYIKTSDTWNIRISTDNTKDQVANIDDYLEKMDSIEKYFVSSEYGQLTNRENEEQTTPVENYDVYTQYSETDNLLFHDFPTITSGRLPENQDEIVLGVQSSSGYDIGDVLEITSYDGKVLKSFTVVGKTSSWISYVYGHGVTENDTATVYIEFKDGIDFKEEIGKIKDDISHHFVQQDEILNSFRGLTTPTNDFFKAAVALVAIIVIIISLSSMSLIYNAFYLSLEQKVQQIGLLKSIGSTNKQISIMIYFEGIMLTLMSITIGVGGGFLVAKQALAYIGSTFNAVVDQLYLFEPQLSPVIILVIYVVGILTVILPIRKSVKFANKVSPVETIRNISLKDNSVKYKEVPKRIEKTFGTSGVIAVKNYDRDRKKHRSTAISLVITIILFISITSFVNYGKTMVYTMDSGDYDIIIGDWPGNKEYQTKLENIMTTLKSEYPDASITRSRSSRLIFKDSDYGKKGMLEYPVVSNLSKYDLSKSWIQHDIVVLSDEDFISHFGSENLLKTVFKNSINGSIELSLNGKAKNVYIDSKYADINPGDVYTYAFTTYNHEEAEKTENYAPDPLLVDISLDIIVDKLPFEVQTYGSYKGLYLVVSDSKLAELSLDKYYGSEGADTLFKSSYIKSEQYDEIYTRFHELENIENEESESKLYFNIYNKTRETIFMTSILGTVDVVTKLVTAFIIVICISNLLNVLASNSRQRLKEYGVYRSVGMDIRSLRKMVFLETILTSWKPLIIGIASGVGVSYIMQALIEMGMEVDSFQMPWEAMGQALLLVVVIQLIQLYSSMQLLKKSNIVQDLKRMEM